MSILLKAKISIERFAHSNLSVMLRILLNSFSTWTLAQKVQKIFGVVFGKEYTTESKISKETRICGMFQGYREENAYNFFAYVGSSTNSTYNFFPVCLSLYFSNPVTRNNESILSRLSRGSSLHCTYIVFDQHTQDHDAKLQLAA